MGAVQRVANVASWELGRHSLLCGKRDCLILLGEEKANLNTIVPRLEQVVIREDASGFGLELCQSLGKQSLIFDVGVGNLRDIGSTDELTLGRS